MKEIHESKKLFNSLTICLIWFFSVQFITFILLMTSPFNYKLVTYIGPVGLYGMLSTFIVLVLSYIILWIKEKL